MAGKSAEKTDRIIRLLFFLSSKSLGGGATLKEIMDECGMSDRQVYRDINTLANCESLKLSRPPKGKKTVGRYRLDEMLPLKIGPESAAMIFLSMLRQQGSPLALGMQNVKDILVNSLFRNRYGNRDNELTNLSQRIHLVEEKILEPEKCGDVLLRLVEAMRQNKAVRMKYFKAKQRITETRKIYPYGLACKHNTWYLVGHCCESEGLRTFRLDCVEFISMLDREVFKMPDAFSLSSYFGTSWGVFADDEPEEVTIKVSSEFAYRFRFIQYHPSQEIIKTNDDGSIIIRYITSGWYEFTGWLLQWAEFVEVLEPLELRQIMKDKLEIMAGKYV